MFASIINWMFVPFNSWNSRFIRIKTQIQILYVYSNADSICLAKTIWMTGSSVECIQKISSKSIKFSVCLSQWYLVDTWLITKQIFVHGTSLVVPIATPTGKAGRYDSRYFDASSNRSTPHCRLLAALWM